MEAKRTFDDNKPNKPNGNTKKINYSDRCRTFKENSTTETNFQEIKRKFKTIDHKIKDIKYLRNKFKDFNSINPLRRATKPSNSFHMKKKERAVMESVVNLKLQYILFNISDFIRKYQMKNNPNINIATYKPLITIRNICLFIYGIILFFEKPWFCYNKATIPLPSYFEFKKDCSKIAFLGLPFLGNAIFRIIEIFIVVIIFLVLYIKYKSQFFFNDELMELIKYSKIIQIFIFVCLILCFIDLMVSLITGNFPIINFILRSFIYIYMLTRIRKNWIRIGKVLWKTKTVFLFLFMIILVFSLIGYFLFREAKDFFGTFINSVLQLYILLAACNFPDIMLQTLEITKLAIFYFIIYLCINFFVVLSYLKTLYYTKYYKVNKDDCLDIIKFIFENDFHKDLFKLKEFKKFLLRQKYIYSLNDEEYNTILVVLNLEEENKDLFENLAKTLEISPEQKLVTKNSLGKLILRNIILEIVINLICVITLFVAQFNFNGVQILSLQLAWSVILLFELFYLIIKLGFKRFFARHFNRVVFHFFNLIIIIIIIYLIVMDKSNENKILKYQNRFKLFISLRLIRIFVFLDKFRVVKNIYTIIRNSKEMFYRNLFTLYSLFLIFSTFSILLTGGNIEKDSFANDDSIPKDYSYINFNDFPSSFITCFCLLMINNLNILINSLTHKINSNKIVFQFYFATFYFFSTLIIINIIQTLILELYLNSDYSISDKDKNNDKQKEKKEENKDEKIVEMSIMNFDEVYD